MATLYDHRGRPVNLDALRRAHADPERDWRISAQRDEVASFVDPERLAELLRGADEGDPLAYLTLAEEMEEKELHYSACLQQLKFAICDAQVAVAAASDSEEHQLHAELVRELVEDPRRGFMSLVFDMHDALGKGYSINEQLWQTDSPDGRWWPRGWKWRDPRWYRLDHQTLERLSLDDGTLEGSPLPPYKYVVHTAHRKSGAPVRAGLARIAGIAYALKRYTIQQLLRFLEVYGIPARLGKYRAGASQEEKMNLLRQVRKIGADACAVIPEDAKIEFLDGMRGAKGGAEGFIGTANYWDSQVSKVILGQTMTTDEGASFSQSKTHAAVKVSFAQHYCRQASATISRDVVAPFIDLNFGPQERYPRVLLTVIEPEELAGWSDALSKMIDRGLRVDERHVRARLGLPEPEPSATLLTPPPMGFNDPSARRDERRGGTKEEDEPEE